MQHIAENATDNYFPSDTTETDFLKVICDFVEIKSNNNLRHFLISMNAKLCPNF